ncbi:hypothetical protein [Streptomyces chartreusis]|uniref:hypothetical protein n=1 Tax=Streptomyces chartreusis TaxID=1969 RepID=UPI0036386F24
MRGTFARREDVLPQVMTWHEPDSGSLRDFQAHHDDYRALERRCPDVLVRLNLAAGDNRVAVRGEHAAVRSLDVSGDGSAEGALGCPAAAAVLSVGAELVASPHASTGSCIGRLGNSPAITAEFTVDAEPVKVTFKSTWSPDGYWT